MPGSFRIARILGIDLRVHLSWILIFLLVTFSLADQVFPFSYPSWSQQKTVIVAAVTALLFFGSVVLHELAHALVARRFRMSVSSITLFLLGGVASLTKEPPSAKAEFFMAVAGPATSLAVGGVALEVSQLVTDTLARAPSLQPVEAVAGYLGYVNIAVAVFNLIPGFPLDGGRVLRSIIWAIRSDRTGATRIAARGGQAVAGLFALWAGYRVLTGDPTGLWMGLIAYFLYGAASQTLQQEKVVEVVGNARVAQLMTADFHAVPRGTSIGALVREVMLPQNRRAVPVVDGSWFDGLVTIADLRKAEQERWPDTPVEAVMTPARDLPSVSPADTLVAALERFGDELPLLPVVDGAGTLVGLLHRESVVGYVRMREMLGFDARR
ncbi:MAG TPA: site-2 protease family protein [Candidatus Limnocylindria bacterium]|nr:site-2 protease family protein [Candidatus Limnocylindria bacterium]